MRPFTVASAAILIAAGALFGASAVASGGQDLRAERATALSDLIREQSRDLAELQQEVTALTAEVDALASEAGGTPEGAAARQRIAANQALAGQTPVTGTGLRVTLDDAPPESRELDVLPDDLVVHQQDVQAVVNALWRGGASAMQIMDQRVIATSAVRCVGSTLILQGRVYSPPFSITAIGDPDRLRSALDADPQVSTYRSWVEFVGLGYLVEPLSEVTIPAYSGALDVTGATAVQG